MNKTKIGLIALAVLVVGAVGVVAAQSEGESISDEEKTAFQQERQAAMFEKCVEENGEEFCTAMQELRAEHEAERDALFEEYGVEKPVREGPPKGHHHRGPPA